MHVLLLRRTSRADRVGDRLGGCSRGVLRRPAEDAPGNVTAKVPMKDGYPARVLHVDDDDDVPFPRSGADKVARDL